jgi:hypothetical protein
MGDATFGTTDDVEQITTEGGHTVEVGDRYEEVQPTYADTRVPAVVSSITRYHFSGSRSEVKLWVRYDVPEDHEYAHLDGMTGKVRSPTVNADFRLGLKLPEWDA